MAYIYRYGIYEDQISKECILSNIENIQQQIRKKFDINLKSCRVTEKKIEIKLHYAVTNYEIEAFLNNLKLSNNDWEVMNNLTGDGLKVKQLPDRYYAYVDYSYDKNTLSLIDYYDIESNEFFLANAYKSAEEYIKNIGHVDNKTIELYDNLVRAYYMDVFTLYLCEKQMKERLTSDSPRRGKQYRIYEISGIKSFVSTESVDKDYNSYNFLEAALDAEVLIDKDGKYSDLRKLGTKVPKATFKISHISALSFNDEERLRGLLNLLIKDTKSIYSLTAAEDANNYTVINIGQGLATRLSKDKKNILFFDFGASEGKNRHCKPTKVDYLVNGDEEIIISHLHRDHWFGIEESCNSNVLKCNWYVPKQDAEYQLIKRFADILISGGSVKYVCSTIESPNKQVVVFMGDKSKHKPTRSTKHRHKHETGLGFFLNLKSNSSTRRESVLTPGDMWYDYIPNGYMKELDYLVASHHGGRYSWSDRKNVHMDIPENTDDGLIVYSCGYKNTYGHPSKDVDYKVKRWLRNWETKSKGNFKIK